MKSTLMSIMALASIAALTFMAAADDKAPARNAGKNAAFEKIKALAGEWEITGAEEQGLHKGTVTYKVTAGGSAVLETLFGGTDHEMITLYYMEGGNLALTHYCMLHNRPHMRAEKQSSPEKIVFKCPAGENAKLDAEDHMHQATFTFVDADHLKTEWVLYKGGKPDSAHSFELTRKKK
jgi:hypothetical protein